MFSVVVETRKLSIDTIPEGRQTLRNLLFKLEGEGLSNRQIADYLRTKGIRTPRDRIYTSKLVWVTLKKWKEREERIAYRKISYPTKVKFVRNDS